MKSSVAMILAVASVILSGFIARLVRASRRYREVTGSNPVEVLNLHQENVFVYNISCALKVPFCFCSSRGSSQT